MIGNPLYFFLKTKNTLTVKTTQDQKSYFLLPIKVKKSDRLLLKDQVYVLSEHHLSVYEKFSNEINELSPIHYTARCRSQTNTTIILHIYFDSFGGYLASHVYMNNLEKTAIDIGSDESRLAIRYFAEPHIDGLLTPIFQGLFDSQLQAKEKRNQALTKLEKESYTGTKSHSYRALLIKAIDAFDEYNNLQFYPQLAVKNFLQRYLAILQKENSTPKATKSSRKFKKSFSPSSQITESETSKPLLVEKKGQQAAPLSTPETPFDSAEKKLYKNMEQCSPHDLNTLLSIFKKLNKLEDLRTEQLIQACIEGNQKKIETYLKTKNDIFLIPVLLSTAAYHNHQELFSYLHEKNKLKELVSFPYIKTNPLTKDISIPHPLSIAHKKKNLLFFRALLDKYHYKPDVLNVTGYPLLNSLVQDKKDTEYARALLEAKANPNLTGESGMIISFEQQEEKIKPCIHTLTGSELSRTALHQAVSVRNTEGVKLLLDYKADSTLRTTDGFSPFGAGVYSNKYPLNRSIIKIFLEKGHQIDEYSNNDQPSTGLYFACQYNKLEAVKILLELKADPCAKHQIKMIQSGGKFFFSTQTPLSVAAHKGFNEIVTEIVNTVPTISLAEIERAMAVCQPHLQETKEILEKTYWIKYSSKMITDNGQQTKDSTSIPKVPCQVLQHSLKEQDVKGISSLPAGLYVYQVPQTVKRLLKKYEIHAPSPSKSDIERLLRTMVANACKVENWRKDFEILLTSIPTLDMNAKDKKGKTALDWAIEKGNMDYATTLLEKGADRSLIDMSKISSAKILQLLFPTPTTSMQKHTNIT